MSSSREVDPGVPIPRVPRLSCPVLCDWTHKKPGWTQKKAAPSSWRLRQRLGTATLVTSNLLILVASNVLLPRQPHLVQQLVDVVLVQPFQFQRLQLLGEDLRLAIIPSRLLMVDARLPRTCFRPGHRLSRSLDTP